jgi:hypothetical protein
MEKRFFRSFGRVVVLTNRAGLEILAGDANEIFRVERIPENSPDVLLLTSRGNLNSDISNIRKVRMVRQRCAL